MKFLFLTYLISVVAFSQTECRQGEEQYKKGNFKDAEKQYLKCLETDPENAHIQEALGDVKCAQKDWEGGLAYFTGLKNRFPKNANYWYKYGGALGMVANESGKFKALTMIGEVRESFEKAIALNPKHIEARWALVEYYLVLPGILGGSESKAKEYASQLAKLSAVDGHLAYGRIAEYFNRLAQAEKHYRNAYAIGKSNTTYQKLHDIYKKTNQSEKARQLAAEHSKIKS